MQAKFSRLSQEQKDNIVRLRTGGLSVGEISSSLELSVSTVRWVLSSLGVKASSTARSKNRSDAQSKLALNALKDKGFDSWDGFFDYLAASRGGKRVGPYVNSRTRLQFECKQGHRFEAKASNIQQGQWCPVCAREARRLPFGCWQARAKALGGELLGTYLGYKKKHPCRCAKGHLFEAWLSDIQGGHWCPVCAGNAPASEQQQGDIARARGGDLVAPAPNVMQKASYLCEHGHRFDMRPNNVQQGQWCPRCSMGNRASAGQKEVLSYVRTLTPEAECSNRSVISPLELDIFVPKLNVGIEYNGLLWHSSYVDKLGRREYDSRKHLKKWKACVAAGVSLFAFFEDEWVTKRDLLQAMIRFRLGLFEGQRLHARQLELCDNVSQQVSREFFSRNHLDGYAAGRRSYGLYYKGDLVCCAGIRKNFAGEIEISRLATDYNYLVPGGAARLVSAIKRDLGDTPLVSYSNNRLSQGNMYQKLGFEKVKIMPPSYWYTDGVSERVWRFSCKRINDPEILAEFPTEREQAAGGVFSAPRFGDRRPLYQLHDYGHIKWILA